VSESDKPTVVCLCGSTRFLEAYQQANKSETLAGRIVLSVGMFGHHEGLDMDGPVKAMLDRLHLAKIDLADEILVLNVGGYVGESTAREIEHARATRKRVRYLVEQFIILMTRRNEMPADIGVVKTSSHLAEPKRHGTYHMGSALKLESEAEANGLRDQLAARNPGWCYTVMRW
jgi:hypothetical protein